VLYNKSTHYVKSFARPFFQKDFLRYVRYYNFIRPNTELRYFLPFPTLDFWYFHFAFQSWFSCSFSEPEYSSCLLNAVCHVASKSGIRYTLSRKVALPFDFDTVNVIYDTSMKIHLRSTPILTPYN
jgi:hypothetical protein